MILHYHLYNDFQQKLFDKDKCHSRKFGIIELKILELEQSQHGHMKVKSISFHKMGESKIRKSKTF